MSRLDDLLCFDDGQAKKVPFGPHCELRNTSNAGRSLFAVVDIPEHTIIHNALKPFAWTFLSDYKKEICSYCFYYDGSTLKHKQLSSTGAKRFLRAFCSKDCHQKWLEESTAVGLEMVENVDQLLRKKGKPRQSFTQPGAATKREIEKLWHEANALGEKIKSLRRQAHENPKSCRKLLQKAANLVQPLTENDDLDLVVLLSDAILQLFLYPESWSYITGLQPSLAPYFSQHSGYCNLLSHIRIFLNLLFILPGPLLPYATPATIVGLVTRDSGNSFGIWCEEANAEDKEESERNYLLGYGLYPTARFILFFSLVDP